MISIMKATPKIHQIPMSKYKLMMVFGVLLTVVQQYPLIRDRFYSEIRFLLYFIFAILSVAGMKKLTAMKIPIFVRLYIELLL